MVPASIRVPGVDAVIAAGDYGGVARRLVAGLKFAGRLQLARPAAAAVAAVAPDLEGTVLVPVPAAPRRARRRGFDAAEEIAVQLAGLTGLDLCRCLARESGPRQVGRRRSDRIGDPPRVRARRPVPARVALVDDVVTTGATLASCARALRPAGSRGVIGLAFTHSTGIRLGATVPPA